MSSCSDTRKYGTKIRNLCLHLIAVVLGSSFVFCPLAARGIASLLEEIAQELNSVARILGDPPADW